MISDLSDAERKLISASFPRLIAVSGEFEKEFYKRLFQVDPRLETLFEDPQAQARKFISFLMLLVRSVDNLDDVRPLIRRLGVLHMEIGVGASMYKTMGEVLESTLRRFLHGEGDDEFTAAWMRFYGALASEMLDATSALSPPPTSKGAARDLSLDW